MALRFALKIDVPDAYQCRVADMDKNGAIALNNAQRILKIALRIETGL